MKRRRWSPQRNKNRKPDRNLAKKKAGRTNAAFLLRQRKPENRSNQGLLCCGDCSRIAAISFVESSILSKNWAAPKLSANARVSSSMPKLIARTFAPFSKLSISLSAT